VSIFVCERRFGGGDTLLKVGPDRGQGRGFRGGELWDRRLGERGMFLIGGSPSSKEGEQLRVFGRGKTHGDGQTEKE